MTNTRYTFRNDNARQTTAITERIIANARNGLSVICRGNHNIGIRAYSDSADAVGSVAVLGECKSCTACGDRLSDLDFIATGTNLYSQSVFCFRCRRYDFPFSGHVTKRIYESFVANRTILRCGTSCFRTRCMFEHISEFHVANRASLRSGAGCLFAGRVTECGNIIIAIGITASASVSGIALLRTGCRRCRGNMAVSRCGSQFFFANGASLRFRTGCFRTGFMTERYNQLCITNAAHLRRFTGCTFAGSVTERGNKFNITKRTSLRIGAIRFRPRCMSERGNKNFIAFDADLRF